MKTNVLTKEQRQKLATVNWEEKAGFVSAETVFSKEIGPQGSSERADFDAKARAWYFGELLRERRQTLGITQKDLAERVGRERTYINRIEKGETDMQLSSFLRIATALGYVVRLEPVGA